MDEKTEQFMFSMIGATNVYAQELRKVAIELIQQSIDIVSSITYKDIDTLKDSKKN